MFRRWRLWFEPEPWPYASSVQWMEADEAVRVRQELSIRLAPYFNETPERFFTRRGAIKAGLFYTQRLGLPLIFKPEFLHEPVTLSE